MNYSLLLYTFGTPRNSHSSLITKSIITKKAIKHKNLNNILLERRSYNLVPHHKNQVLNKLKRKKKKRKKKKD